MNGSELAGFVHGAEVEEPAHLAAVVHRDTLWPPEQAPPPRVARTVVCLCMLPTDPALFEWAGLTDCLLSA